MKNVKGKTMGENSAPAAARPRQLKAALDLALKISALLTIVGTAVGFLSLQTHLASEKADWAWSGLWSDISVLAAVSLQFAVVMVSIGLIFAAPLAGFLLEPVGWRWRWKPDTTLGEEDDDAKTAEKGRKSRRRTSKKHAIFCAGSGLLFGLLVIGVVYLAVALETTSFLYLVLLLVLLWPLGESFFLWRWLRGNLEKESLPVDSSFNAMRSFVGAGRGWGGWALRRGWVMFTMTFIAWAVFELRGIFLPEDVGITSALVTLAFVWLLLAIFYSLSDLPDGWVSSAALVVMMLLVAISIREEGWLTERVFKGRGMGGQTWWVDCETDRCRKLGSYDTETGWYKLHVVLALNGRVAIQNSANAGARGWIGDDEFVYIKKID